MTYKDTETVTTYDSNGHPLTVTITQYGGVGTNIADNTQMDVAFPDPVVVEMKVTEGETGGGTNSNQNITLNCGYGSEAHEHCHISLAPAFAQMWFTYYYRINLGPPYGWITLVYDTNHFQCETWVFPAGFTADFHANANQSVRVAHVSGQQDEFDAHCG